jgi:hypothetical protein
MIVVQFPFNLEDPDMQRGFEQGKNPNYQPVKPISDTELVSFVRDFLEDGKDHLAYNIGFLLGLYTPQESTGNDGPARL